MRIGVIADIHANLPALETSLGFLHDRGVDRVVCLGDLVGYGPQPNEVVARIAQLEIPTVMGNHDLVAAGIDALERSGEDARRSLEWTRQQLTDATRDFLRALPPRIEMDEILAAHGGIDDPWLYVRRVPDVVAQLERMTATTDRRILLVGHTHRQMAVDIASGEIATSEGVLARRHRTVRLTDVAFVNPGTVGQARELRPLARCAILDLGARVIHLHALRYPSARCKQELTKRGLPTEWCHSRPTPKKIVRQVLRDAADRRRALQRNRSVSDID